MQKCVTHFKLLNNVLMREGGGHLKTVICVHGN